MKLFARPRTGMAKSIMRNATAGIAKLKASLMRNPRVVPSPATRAHSARAKAKQYAVYGVQGGAGTCLI